MNYNYLLSKEDKKRLEYEIAKFNSEIKNQIFSLARNSEYVNSYVKRIYYKGLALSMLSEEMKDCLNVLQPHMKYVLNIQQEKFIKEYKGLCLNGHFFPELFFGDYNFFHFNRIMKYNFENINPREKDNYNNTIRPCNNGYIDSLKNTKSKKYFHFDDPKAMKTVGSFIRQFSNRKDPNLLGIYLCPKKDPKTKKKTLIVHLLYKENTQKEKNEILYQTEDLVVYEIKSQYVPDYSKIYAEDEAIRDLVQGEIFYDPYFDLHNLKDRYSLEDDLVFNRLYFSEYVIGDIKKVINSKKEEVKIYEDLEELLPEEVKKMSDADEENYEKEKFEHEIADFKKRGITSFKSPGWEKLVNGDYEVGDGIDSLNISDDELYIFMLALKAIYFDKSKLISSEILNSIQCVKFVATKVNSKLKSADKKFPKFIFDNFNIRYFREIVKMLFNKEGKVTIEEIDNAYNGLKNADINNSHLWLISNGFAKYLPSIEYLINNEINESNYPVVGLIAYPHAISDGDGNYKIVMEMVTILEAGTNVNVKSSISADFITLKRQSLDYFDNPNFEDVQELLNGTIVYDPEFKIFDKLLENQFSNRFIPYQKQRISLGYEIRDTLRTAMQNVLNQKKIKK